MTAPSQPASFYVEWFGGTDGDQLLAHNEAPHAGEGLLGPSLPVSSPRVWYMFGVWYLGTLRTISRSNHHHLAGDGLSRELMVRMTTPHIVHLKFEPDRNICTRRNPVQGQTFDLRRAKLVQGQHGRHGVTWAHMLASLLAKVQKEPSFQNRSVPTTGIYVHIGAYMYMYTCRYVRTYVQVHMCKHVHRRLMYGLPRTGRYLRLTAEQAYTVSEQCIFKGNRLRFTKPGLRE